MEAFSWADGVALLIFVISAALAYSRGFVRESLSIGGWILAAIVAYGFAPQVTPLIKEIPLLSDLIGQSCELSTMAAFGAVFTLGLIVFAFIVPWIAVFVHRSSLNSADQILGLFFGVVRGFLLVLIVLVLFDRVTAAQRSAEDWTAAVHESRTKIFLSDTQERLEAMIPANTSDWLLGHYQYLMRECPAPQLDTAPAEPTSEDIQTTPLPATTPSAN